VSATAILAALAAGCAVPAAWDVLKLTEQRLLAGGVAGALAPWQHAGRHGTAAADADRRRLGVLAAWSSCGASWLLSGPLAGMLAALCAPLLVRHALAWRRERWRHAAAEGAPLVARAIADALSGGHSPRGALVDVAARGGAGAQADAALRAVGDALALGEPTDAVLERWRDRVRAPGYDVLVAAILLHRDAGGDLARLLRDLAADLEDGRRASADARAATAQARFTATVVCSLPVAAALLAELASPGALASMLGQPLSRMLAIAAALLDVVALLAVRRLSRVAL
jgi:tight adherence protein B